MKVELWKVLQSSRPVIMGGLARWGSGNSAGPFPGCSHSPSSPFLSSSLYWSTPMPTGCSAPWIPCSWDSGLVCQQAAWQETRGWDEGRNKVLCPLLPAYSCPCSDYVTSSVPLRTSHSYSFPGHSHHEVSSHSVSSVPGGTSLPCPLTPRVAAASCS